MPPKSILRHLLVLNIAVLIAFHYAAAQAGTLDPAFATGGIFSVPGSTSAGNAVAIQSDGKIVVAGVGALSGNYGDVLLRLNTNGTLDSTFGSGGVASIPGNNGFVGVAIQSDGKIVAAPLGVASVKVARVETDGSLDTSFGSGGLTAGVDVHGTVSGGLALQANGELVVVVGALQAGNPSLMARFTTSGQLDATFGSGGEINLQYGTPTQVAVLSNGKILVTSGEVWEQLGEYFYLFPQAGSITRYNSNGTVDTTFGAAGRAGSVASASALVLQSNGQIVVGGSITSKVNAPGTPNDVGFGIVRYNANGSLDSTFGTGGVAITDFGTSANDSGAFALALQSNGDIVAAGAAGNLYLDTFDGSSFGLSRSTSAGVLDTTFGAGGITITTIASGQISWLDAMAIQSDGKIVVAGSSKFGTDSENGYVARYLSE
jgi:uncharacterized delta-60 repeat protein